MIQQGRGGGVTSKILVFGKIHTYSCLVVLQNITLKDVTGFLPLFLFP